MWSCVAKPARKLFFVFAALLWLFTFARADAADQKTFLPLVLNGVDTSTVLALLRDGDILVRAADLAAAGLHVNGKHETIDNTDFVSLRSLEPALTFKLDPVKAELLVEAPAAFFGSNQVNLGVTQPEGLRYGSQRGGYVNYALSQTNGSFSTYAETALTNGHAILTAGVEDASQGFVRSSTALEFDDRAKLRRTVIGDATLSSPQLFSSALIGGFTVRRDTSLNPYALTRPLFGFAGSTTRPATALVYANGVLIKTVDLQPGSFNFNNLPLTDGSANIRVVVRDALGNTTTLGRNLYVASDLLSKGFTDYAYSAGFLRENSLIGQSTYGPGVAIANYRLGVSNTLTAGGAFEAGGGIVSGGPDITTGTKIGQFSLAGAVSSEHGSSGSATLISYNYAGHILNVQAGLLSQSPHFARLSLDATADRLLHDESLNLTGRLARGVTIGIALNRSAYRDSGVDNATSLNLGTTLGPATLLVTATRSFVAASTPQYTRTIYANLFFSRPGRNTTGQLSERTDQVGTTTTVAVEKPANAGVGFGYLASVSRGALPGSEIALNERLPFAVASFDRSSSPQVKFTDITLSGSVATLGTGLLFGRPIDGAYAIVATPMLSGLPIYVGGEYQGRTDRNGRLLLPELAPNFENSVNIDVRSLPPDVDVKQTKELVAPFARTGLLVAYGTHQIRAITGKVNVRRAGVTTAPDLSEMTITLPGGPVTQGLGGEGTFYFEDIPAGRFRAHVDDDKGGCTFTIAVPASVSQPVINLGTLVCEAP